MLGYKGADIKTLVPLLATDYKPSNAAKTWTFGLRKNVKFQNGDTFTCDDAAYSFRRAVIAGRMLRVTGRIQREAGVVHVVAERIEDISWMLDELLRPGFAVDGAKAGDQP